MRHEHPLATSIRYWLWPAPPRPPRWKWNGSRHFAPFSKTAAGHRRRRQRKFVRSHKEAFIHADI